VFAENHSRPNRSNNRIESVCAASARRLSLRCSSKWSSFSLPSARSANSKASCDLNVSSKPESRSKNPIRPLHSVARCFRASTDVDWKRSTASTNCQPRACVLGISRPSVRNIAVKPGRDVKKTPQRGLPSLPTPECTLDDTPLSTTGWPNTVWDRPLPQHRQTSPLRQPSLKVAHSGTGRPRE